MRNKESRGNPSGTRPKPPERINTSPRCACVPLTSAGTPTSTTTLPGNSPRCSMQLPLLVADTTIRALARAAGMSSSRSAFISAARRLARGEACRPTSNNCRQRGPSSRAHAVATLPGIPTTATVSRRKSMSVSAQMLSKFWTAAKTVRLLPVVTATGPRSCKWLPWPPTMPVMEPRPTISCARLRGLIHRLFH